MTTRQKKFRRDVSSRDGKRCVVSGQQEEDCQAVHIIPRSKGDEYIQFVLSDRAPLYSGGERLELDGIDCTENGIFLFSGFHARFDSGKIVFLKTPNFAMKCTDVPVTGYDVPPASRTTMQYLVQAPELHMVFPQSDVKCDWSVGKAPPNILLDFMYGAAVVKHWGAPGIQGMLAKRYLEDFSKIPPRPHENHTSEDEDEDGVESDDSKDDDYVDKGSGRNDNRGRRRKHHGDEGMSRAMDTVLGLSLLLQGVPPQSLRTVWEKRKEEAELRSREAGKEKARQWLEADISVGVGDSAVV